MARRGSCALRARSALKQRQHSFKIHISQQFQNSSATHVRNQNDAACSRRRGDASNRVQPRSASLQSLFMPVNCSPALPAPSTSPQTCSASPFATSLSPASPSTSNHTFPPPSLFRLIPHGGTLQAPVAPSAFNTHKRFQRGGAEASGMARCRGGAGARGFGRMLREAKYSCT